MSDEDTEEDESDTTERGPTIHQPSQPASATIVLNNGDIVLSASADVEFDVLVNYLSSEARYWANKADCVFIDEGDEIHQHIHDERRK